MILLDSEFFQFIDACAKNSNLQIVPSLFIHITFYFYHISIIIKHKAYIFLKDLQVF